MTQGAKKGPLSKFIEEAVRWRLFHRTVQDIKARNADTGPDELQSIIDDAVREVRDDMVQMGHPAAVYRAWQEGHFTLLTCAEQLDELRATLRKPAIAERIKPDKAGQFAQIRHQARLVNEMKGLAEDVGALPRVQRSPDPTDDFLLALSEAGKADFLVTGDKGGLLAFARHLSTRIVSAREFAALFA